MRALYSNSVHQDLGKWDKIMTSFFLFLFCVQPGFEPKLILLHWPQSYTLWYIGSDNRLDVNTVFTRFPVEKQFYYAVHSRKDCHRQMFDHVKLFITLLCHIVYMYFFVITSKNNWKDKAQRQVEWDYPRSRSCREHASRSPSFHFYCHTLLPYKGPCSKFRN